MIGLLEFAAKQQLATISLEVRSESNQAAIALYKKFGFSERESLFSTRTLVRMLVVT